MTWARALGLFGVAYAALLLNACFSVLVAWPLPDLALLVALYAGLTCRLRGGAAVVMRDASPAAMVGLGAAIGYFTDVVSGTPRGLHALGFALLLLLLRAVAGQLLVRGTSMVMAVAFLCALLFRVLLVLLMRLHDGESGLYGLRSAPSLALSTAVAAPLMFALLSRIDARLWRDPRAQGLAYER